MFGRPASARRYQERDHPDQPAGPGEDRDRYHDGHSRLDPEQLSLTEQGGRAAVIEPCVSQVNNSVDDQRCRREYP
jgi:hypothetical protein